MEEAELLLDGEVARLGAARRRALGAEDAERILLPARTAADEDHRQLRVEHAQVREERRRAGRGRSTEARDLRKSVRTKIARPAGQGLVLGEVRERARRRAVGHEVLGVGLPDDLLIEVRGEGRQRVLDPIGRQRHQVVAAGRRGSIAKELRVELAKHRRRQARRARHRPKPRPRGHRELTEIGRVRDLARRASRPAIRLIEPKMRPILSDDREGVDLWDVARRLFGQEPRAGELGERRRPPPLARAELVHRADDALEPDVVGREREIPAVEALVEIAEVGDRGRRGAAEALPFVDPVALLEAVERARLGHELKESRGAGGREAPRIEAALDRRYPDEILGQARLAQGELDPIAVHRRPPEPREERRAPPVGAREEAHVAHRPAGDRDRDVRHRERAERHAVGVVEVLVARTLEVLGDRDVERRAVGLEAAAIERRRRVGLGIEEARIAERARGGDERGARARRSGDARSRDDAEDAHEGQPDSPRPPHHGAKIHRRKRAPIPRQTDAGRSGTTLCSEMAFCR